MSTNYYYDVTTSSYRTASPQEIYIESLRNQTRTANATSSIKKTNLQQIEDLYRNTPNLSSITNMIEEALDDFNISLNEDDTFVISFNPYSMFADIRSDLNSQLTSNISSALNSNNNSKNLFYEALYNSTNINDDALTKMQAYRSIYDTTGYDISSLRLEDGNFYTSNNRNIIDVIQERLEQTALTSTHKHNAIGQIKDILSDVAQIGWNNMPDLQVGIIYSKKAGAFVTGLTYDA